MLITFTIIMKMISIVGYGMMLGIGFYLSKKITNKFDEQLILNNKGLMAEYANLA